MKKMNRFLLIIFSIFLYCQAWAQPTVFGSQLVDGNYVTYDLSLRGAVRAVRLQATSSAGASARNWEFATGTAGSTNYSTNWRPYTGGNTLSGYNTLINPASAASARYNTGFGGASGLLPAVTANNYYTVIVGTNATSDNLMSIVETSYNPKTISSSRNPPGTVYNGQPVTINVSLNAAPSSGERVFVRWHTGNGFANANFSEVTNFGGTANGSVALTGQSAGTTVTYYVLSTTQTSPSNSTIDYFTLSIDNNNNTNYSYSTSSTYGTIANGNWSNNATWANGSAPPANATVIIDHNVTLDQPATVSSLTINSGKTFTASDASPRTLTIVNSVSPSTTNTIVNNGTWQNGAGASTVLFTGAPANQDNDAVQTTAGTIPFQNVTINKTGGNGNVGVSFGTNSSISGTLEIGRGGYVATAPPASFYGANAILKFNQGSGAVYDVGATDNSWSTSQVPNNITITSGTVNLNASRTAPGNLLIDGGTLRLNNNNPSLTIQGNWTRTSGNFDAGTGTGAVILSGATNTTIDVATIALMRNLTIQKTGGASVTVGGSNNIQVSGTLTFTNGNITTGSNKVIITSTGSVSGAGAGTGWVVGNLQKNVSTGPTSRTFEIGGATNYRPVTVVFGNVNTAGDLTASVSQGAGDHSNIATSGIDASKSVNRFWTLTNSGITFTNYGATFTFVSGDVDGGANTSNFVVRKFNGTTWQAGTAGIRTATTTQATGFTVFSDFAIGEVSQASADYTSNGPVNLTTATNWLYNNGIENVTATQPPTGSNNININGGHAFTIDANLAINSGKSLAITSGNVIISPNIVLSGTGTINFNGQPVTIKSTADGTGSLGQLAANGGNVEGATNVTVERYIPAQDRRAYRQLSASVMPTGTIRATWQEGQNNTSTTANSNTTPGYGMHITGSSSGANGFDATVTGNASMFVLNTTTIAWDALANTNATNLDPKKGYLVFVRGGRGVDLNSNTSSSNTTLRATGSLLLGNQAYSVLSGNRYNFITNPFASSIDWTKIYAANGGSTAFNVNNYVYYDPNLNIRGGYVTVQLDGSNNLFYPEAEAIHIQSGQAFWVQPKTGTTSITIHEADKSALNNRNVFRQNNGEIEKLQIGLYFTTASTGRRIADGIAVKFGNDYSKEIGPEDATKFTNFDEDIAILRNGTRLSIEGRPLIADADTLPLYMAKMKQQAYEWQFDASQFNAPGLQAWLQDKFLNTETQVALTGQTIVPFTVTSNAASSAADRFRIVFRTVQVLPINFTTVKAFEKGSAVQVEWNLGNEAGVQGYEVEKSADGRTFGKLGSVQVRSAQSTLNYAFVDPSPNSGNNYYRIRANEQNGSHRFSQVVNVRTGRTGGEVTIYPNPVKGGVINLQLTNQPAGKYQWQLTNAAGQTLYRGNLTHQGGSLAEQLQVPGKLAAGVYQLQVSSNGTSIVRQVVAE